MSNPALSFIAEGVAAADTSFFTHENLMDMLLITIPTILLAVATLWDNDRMYKITLQALSLLNPRKRHAIPAHHQKGKHESIRGVRTVDSTAVETSVEHIDGEHHNHPKIEVDSNFLSKLEPAE